MNTFPFGNPIKPVRQEHRGKRRVFVLGVYASAVHARWVADNGQTLIRALAVSSEPSIFWKGSDAEKIIESIPVPSGAGRLVPATQSLNGPSGKALDDYILTPIGITREQAWLCDLLPESRCNPSQKSALIREYIPRMKLFGLPEFNFPPVPKILATIERVNEISSELLDAKPEVLITLGDLSLQWYTANFGSKTSLKGYGTDIESYGCLHDITIAGFNLQLLPLVHIRQAGRLGNHSKEWAEIHELWMKTKAETILG